MASLSNQTLNNYSFEVYTKKREYSHLLVRAMISKKVSTSNFVVDRYMFTSDAGDLLTQINDEMRIKITITYDNVSTVIYDNVFIISKAYFKNEILYVETDSVLKDMWIRQADFSKICDNMTCKNAIKSYIDEVIAYTKKPVKFYTNTSENINKYVYEKIMFPLQKHYENIIDIANKYHIINNPFYVFFDDYEFGAENMSTNHFSVGFYNYFEMKSLRAHHMADIKLDRKQYLKNIDTYMSPDLRKDVFNTDALTGNHNDYIQKDLKEDNPSNSNMYIHVSDSDQQFDDRWKNSKKFYEDKMFYAMITLDDFDIRVPKLGDRIVIDDQKTRYQYNAAIVEIVYDFTPIDAASSASSSKKSSMFSINAVVSCILKTEKGDN